MSANAAELFDSTYPVDEPVARVKQDGRKTIEADFYFSTQGRVGVMRYQARFAQMLLVVLFSAFLFGFVSAFESTVASTVAGVIVGFLGFGALAMLVCTAIKRIHDLGRSGWYLLLNLVPIVGVIWNIYYSLQAGKTEDNKYGEFRKPTTSDYVLGTLGILAHMSLIIVSILPE